MVKRKHPKIYFDFVLDAWERLTRFLIHFWWHCMLQLSDVFEVVDVEKDLAAGQELLELVLDDGDGVLQGRKARSGTLCARKAVGQGGDKPGPCSRRG